MSIHIGQNILIQFITLLYLSEFSIMIYSGAAFFLHTVPYGKCFQIGCAYTIQVIAAASHGKQPIQLCFTGYDTVQICDFLFQGGHLRVSIPQQSRTAVILRKHQNMQSWKGLFFDECFCCLCLTGSRGWHAIQYYNQRAGFTEFNILNRQCVLCVLCVYRTQQECLQDTLGIHFFILLQFSGNGFVHLCNSGDRSVKMLPLAALDHLRLEAFQNILLFRRYMFQNAP